MAAAFVPGFELYTALRFAVATAVVGYNFSSVTLLAEWVGPWRRTRPVVLAQCTFSMGQMALAGLTHGVQSWRLFQMAGAAPVFRSSFTSGEEILPRQAALGWLRVQRGVWESEPVGALPETARWLLTRGRVEEAKQPIQRVASVNKRKLSPELLSQKTGPTGNALDLFRHPQLRKVTLILFYVWFVDSLEYFGLGLKLIFRAVEVPARYSSIFVMERLGLKWSQLGTLVLDLPVVGTVMALVGKVATAAGFTISYVYSAELFPTVIRIGGILKPLVILLGEYHTALPMLIYGSLPIGAGLLCALLPETRGQTLKDTIDDLEQESCPQ
eukprot:bmy_20316T0